MVPGSVKAAAWSMHAAFGGDQDVIRFEIAMDDSGCMGGGEAIGDPHCNIQKFARRINRRDR